MKEEQTNVFFVVDPINRHFVYGTGKRPPISPLTFGGVALLLLVICPCMVIWDTLLTGSLREVYLNDRRFRVM